PANANQSYERKPGGGAGGGQDTDDNQSDFSLVSPSAPQNAASVCLGGGAPTNPAGAGAATPASVAPGDTTLFTLTVTPGTHPPSTGITVTGDLTLIGGSSTQQFFDDGTHGDVTAGDQIFSFQAPVASGTAAGTKNLAITV